MITNQTDTQRRWHIGVRRHAIEQQVFDILDGDEERRSSDPNLTVYELLQDNEDALNIDNIIEMLEAVYDIGYRMASTPQVELTQ